MAAVPLYHYYRQGVCACPIYIRIAINTFKVSITCYPIEDRGISDNLAAQLSISLNNYAQKNRSQFVGCRTTI